MPKRKKLPSVPDYTGSSTNQTVQKSEPFMSLSHALPLSLLKILDVYLSRINSHEPEKRYVRFERGELEHLLEVTQIRKQDLDKRLNGLFTAVTIPDSNKRGGFTKIGLFEKAEAKQDDSGLWQVDLACTPSAMEYIFNIENIGYLRYRLRNVVNLTSKYSYTLFLYLEANRFRKSWTVDIEDLKQILDCDKEESYMEFKVFNDRILKRCHKELTEKTECQYNYETVKKGRRVAAIRFTLETLPPLDVEDLDQYTIDNFSAENDPLAFLAAALSLSGDGDAEFTKEQMQEIFTILVTIPDDKLPLCREDGIEFRRYHYLAEKYALMNRVHAQKPIKNRYAYFLKMVKSDA